MKCKMEQLFAVEIEKLSKIDDQEFLVTDGVLPKPNEHMETDQLVVKKVDRSYGSSFRVDAVVFISDKKGYRNLGLLILASVFSDVKEVTLEIRHPASDIKKLVINTPGVDLERLTPGFHEKPYAFSYWVNDVDKHPWIHSEIPRFDLPLFSLTNDEDFVNTAEDWFNRDVIHGFGGNRASVLLAELLLNFGRNDVQMESVVLESDAGFRGVAPASAEASFFLAENDDWANEEFYG